VTASSHGIRISRVHDRSREGDDIDGQPAVAVGEGDHLD